jgi:hypothetical protein
LVNVIRRGAASYVFFVSDPNHLGLSLFYPPLSNVILQLLGKCPRLALGDLGLGLVKAMKPQIDEVGISDASEKGFNLLAALICAGQRQEGLMLRGRPCLFPPYIC